jgi:PAS domain S-box-containing protein
VVRVKKYVIPIGTKRRLIGIAIALKLLYALCVYLYLSSETDTIHKTVEQTLRTIGNSKINQIIQWRRGRLANARSISRSPFSQLVLTRWMANPADPLYRQLLFAQTRLMKAEYGYDDIFLAMRNGDVLLSVDSTNKKLDPWPASFVNKAWSSRDVVESDFYVSSATHKVYYDLLAPMRDEKGRTIALAVFRTDPDDYLFPLIQAWPTPSKSSETLLLRRDGDSIVYLNELRFKKNSAVTFRKSVGEIDLPSVQAALGTTGIIDGKAYTGESVLAYSARIPQTPWFLVAQMDRHELFSELRYRSYIVIILSVIIILLMGAVLIAYYRSLQLNISETALEKESALRKALEDLSASKERYRLLVESLDEGFCVIEIIFTAEGKAADYRFLEVNPAFEKHTGLHDALGKTIRELVPDYDEHWFETYGRVATTGQPIRLEAPSDALHRYYNVFAHRMGGEGSRTVGVLFVDITAQKKLQKALEESRKLLAETEHSGRIGGWAFDVATMEQSWTEETFRILEMETTECSPKVLDGLSFIAPSTRSMAEEAVQRAIEFGEDYSQEWEIITAKGNRRWVHSIAHVHRDDGRVTKITGSFQDITVRKEMEQMLRDIQRRQAVEVLSSGMAHDFNNLLAVMMGNVSMAQTQLPRDHTVQKYMKQTLTAIERAAELIRQILAYSGKGKFQVQDLDLTAEIQTYSAHLYAAMPPNVELTIDVPSKPVTIKGDPDQIRQMIMNLILNARDAIGQGRGNVRLSLSSLQLEKAALDEYGGITGTSLREGSYALLEVNDTGSGIKPEALNHIFDPFFTTKFIGRGLGLSAVLGIVRGHEGGIIVNTAEGKGSTFRILLPQLSHADRIQRPPAIEPGSGDESKRATVLVIDDEEMVAEAARDLLELEHFSVITELSPQKGIETYRLHQIEIGAVIVDWMMPEMTGGDVAAALYAINPNVKIIISSGYSEQEVKSKIDASKVAGFLQKPYSQKTLLAILQSVIT